MGRRSFPINNFIANSHRNIVTQSVRSGVGKEYEMWVLSSQLVVGLGELLGNISESYAVAFH